MLVEVTRILSLTDLIIDKWCTLSSSQFAYELVMENPDAETNLARFPCVLANNHRLANLAFLSLGPTGVSTVIFTYCQIRYITKYNRNFNTIWEWSEVVSTGYEYERLSSMATSPEYAGRARLWIYMHKLLNGNKITK